MRILTWIHFRVLTEARSILAHVGDLHFVGDSLLRHLAQALLTVLSGDYEGEEAFTS